MPPAEPIRFDVSNFAAVERRVLENIASTGPFISGKTMFGPIQLSRQGGKSASFGLLYGMDPHNLLDLNQEASEWTKQIYHGLGLSYPGEEPEPPRRTSWERILEPDI